MKAGQSAALEAWRDRARSFGFTPPALPALEGGCLSSGATTRDSGGFLQLNGVSVEELCEDYETPLVLMNGEECESLVGRFQSWSRQHSAHCTSLPALGAAASREKQCQTPHDVYAVVHAYPRQSILRRLLKQGVGFIVQSSGEAERLRRAGCDGEHCLFAGPFKRPEAMLTAHKAGVGLLELESLPEFKELVEVLAHQNLGSPGRVLRLCLRLKCESTPGGFGLSFEEAQFVLGCALEHPLIEVAGLSLVCSNTAPHPKHFSLRESLREVRDLVNLSRCQNAPIGFLMVGPRDHWEPFSEQASTLLTHLGESIREELEGEPLRVVLTCADALVRYSGHVVAPITRVVPDLRCERDHIARVIVDTTVPPLPLFSGVFPIRMGTVAASPHRLQFFGRHYSSHQPLLLSEAFESWLPRPDELVILPRQGGTIAADGSDGCTTGKPTELWVDGSGDVEVVRTRSYDTGPWHGEAE